MTLQQAHKRAVKLWGKTARVERDPHGARIGAHGEYVAYHWINARKDSPKHGRYRCLQCSTETVEGADLVVRDVYHVPGNPQARYAVGVITLGAFFTIKGQGDSWESAFASAAPKATPDIASAVA